jgi:hypothetical protein
VGCFNNRNLGAMQQNEYCKFCMTAITPYKSIVYNSFIMVIFLAAMPQICPFLPLSGAVQGVLVIV